MQDRIDDEPTATQETIPTEPEEPIEPLVLPAWVMRYRYWDKRDEPKEKITLASYLLDELLWRAHPFMGVGALGESIPYYGCWDQEGITLKQAWDSGIRLREGFQEKPTEPGGQRVYLRREGYAIVFQEINYARRSIGEWYSVLRPLKRHEAVAALGGLKGIFATLDDIGARAAKFSRDKSLKRYAAPFNYWCRQLPLEICADKFLKELLPLKDKR